MDRERRDRLTREALHWLATLGDEDATTDERRAFAAWLATGPDHRAAWDRARQLGQRVDALAPGLRRDGAITQGAPPPRAPAMTRRRWLGATAAAGVAAAAGAVVLARPGLLADTRTGVGERRTLALADGSSVELGSASALSVAFDDGSRRVTLHEGEAFFTVADAPGRPFVVEAANGRSVALGTAFNVKRLPDSVVVNVARHAVAVSSGAGPAATVAAGQQVRYGVRGLGAVESADPGLAQAWRRDRLVFADAPLADVVADLERYRHGRIVVTDRRIAALPVTAVFDARQTDAALRTIADTLPVTLRRVTDLLILLSPSA